MKYLYDGHMGNLYTSETLLSYKERYCETCGDSDQLIGTFETFNDFWNLIKDNCSIDGSGGWSLQYILPFIASEFDIDFYIEYEPWYIKDEGFCSNSEENILKQINEYLK